MKSIVIFLIVSVGLAAVLIGRDSTTADSVKAVNSPAVENLITVQQQTMNIIDGATHPELVPDRVAYSVLFRLISNRQTPEA